MTQTTRGNSLSYLRPKKKANWKDLNELGLRRVTLASEWETHAGEVHGWGEYGTSPTEAHSAIRECVECTEYRQRLMESEGWK